MKSKKCPVCKSRLKPPEQGRHPRYCSAACRQKAYRRRRADPRRQALKLLRNDMATMADQQARARGAVKILEDLGYDVQLEKRQGPPPKKPKPRLSVV